MDQRDVASKNRNMEFLVRIMMKMNLNQREVSERTGYSQQLISYWLKKDNCKYSTIVDLFERMNLKIECSYAMTVERNDEYEVEFNDMLSLADGKRNQMMDKYLSENRPLRFLALLIKSTNLTLKRFCEEYDLDYTHIYHSLSNDCIKVEQIYDIARKTNTKVKWKLSSLDYADFISSLKR